MNSWAYKLDDGGRYGTDVAMPDHIDIDEGAMSMWIPFADGRRRDGVGDLLEISGISTERHRTNPVVLLDHGKQVTLPIALAEDPKSGQYTVVLDPATKSARLNAFFYQGLDPIETDGGMHYTRDDHAVLCEQLFHLAVKKFIRAGSIGYQVLRAMELPPDYQLGVPKGLHLLNVLMLEGSLVVMPANMDTVRKSFDPAREILSLPRVCGRPLSPVLVKSLSPYVRGKAVQLGYEGKGVGPNRTKTSVVRSEGKPSDEAAQQQASRRQLTDQIARNLVAPNESTEGETLGESRDLRRAGVSKVSGVPTRTRARYRPNGLREYGQDPTPEFENRGVRDAAPRKTKRPPENVTRSGAKGIKPPTATGGGSNQRDAPKFDKVEADIYGVPEAERYARLRRTVKEGHERSVGRSTMSESPKEANPGAFARAGYTSARRTHNANEDAPDIKSLRMKYRGKAARRRDADDPELDWGREEHQKKPNTEGPYDATTVHPNYHPTDQYATDVEEPGRPLYPPGRQNTRVKKPRVGPYAEVSDRTSHQGPNVERIRRARTRTYNGFSETPSLDDIPLRPDDARRRIVRGPHGQPITHVQEPAPGARRQADQNRPASPPKEPKLGSTASSRTPGKFRSPATSGDYETPADKPYVPESVKPKAPPKPSGYKPGSNKTEGSGYIGAERPTKRTAQQVTRPETQYSGKKTLNQAASEQAKSIEVLGKLLDALGGVLGEKTGLFLYDARAGREYGSGGDVNKIDRPEGPQSYRARMTLGDHYVREGYSGEGPLRSSPPGAHHPEVIPQYNQGYEADTYDSSTGTYGEDRPAELRGKPKNPEQIRSGTSPSPRTPIKPRSSSAPKQEGPKRTNKPGYVGKPHPVGDQGPVGTKAANTTTTGQNRNYGQVPEYADTDAREQSQAKPISPPKAPAGQGEGRGTRRQSGRHPIHEYHPRGVVGESADNSKTPHGDPRKNRTDFSERSSVYDDSDAPLTYFRPQRQNSSDASYRYGKTRGARQHRTPDEDAQNPKASKSVTLPPAQDDEDSTPEGKEVRGTLAEWDDTINRNNEIIRKQGQGKGLKALRMKYRRGAKSQYDKAPPTPDEFVMVEGPVENYQGDPPKASETNKVKVGTKGQGPNWRDEQVPQVGNEAAPVRGNVRGDPNRAHLRSRPARAAQTNQGGPMVHKERLRRNEQRPHEPGDTRYQARDYAGDVVSRIDDPRSSNAGVAVDEPFPYEDPEHEPKARELRAASPQKPPKLPPRAVERERSRADRQPDKGPVKESGRGVGKVAMTQAKSIDGLQKLLDALSGLAN